MAIVPGDLIKNGILNSTTYGDLNLKILEMIQEKCININTSSLPYPFDKSEILLCERSIDHIYGGLWASAHRSDVAGVKIKIDDPELITVNLGTFTDGEPNENTVAGQLQKFLIDKGVWQLTGDPISFKGIINYVNVISSFLSAKLMLVTSNFINVSEIFYNKNNTSFPEITLISDDKINYSVNECQTSLNDIMNSITNKQNFHYAKTEIIGKCSSCSSSSSSSCSSSSSTYIVYMDI